MALDRADGFEFLAEPVRKLLAESGISSPTPPQADGSPMVAKGENVLIIAPTGSGKTEAAMLPLLSRLVSQDRRAGISLLYITPLRALNRDIFRRLEYWCGRLGLNIDIRHGDTPASARSRQSRSPPDVLVTTPETLQAVLPGSRMRENLKHLEAVVVDELHSLVESKRGVQLCVGLQRLARISEGFQLVGLSATVGTPDVAARFLFGDRKYSIVNKETRKEFAFSIDYPTPDMQDGIISRKAASGPDLAARLARMNELLDAYRSVLIFVNSRTLAEMLGEKLGRIRQDVGVHHGSLPREERERVENAFKSGQLKGLVCTSTLELGIDIGSVDLVVQYMSPRQVTPLIQRVGRSGHSLDRRSEGVILTVSSDDILESAASVLRARKGALEETRPYANSLDVLAHQIAGYLMDFGAMDRDLLLDDIRRTYPYSDLKEDAYQAVVSYLHELRKLNVDGRTLRRTGGTREYYFQNLSMIPDETRYLVIDVAANQAVGILGEEFILLHARPGVHFILKGKIWQIEKISDDRKVYVTHIDDPLAAVPGWDGEMIPVPFELAQTTGRLRKKAAALLEESGFEVAVELMAEDLPAGRQARAAVAEEMQEHVQMGAPLPTDDTVLLEGFGKYLIIHACFGEAVNRTFAFSFEEVLSWKGLVRLWWMDGYRILMELTEDTEGLDLKALASQLFGLSPEELEKTYATAARRNFPFPERVKNIAQRFGALKRGMYVSHPNLCSLPTRFERTPIYDEAVQESGRDLIDMERAKLVLSRVARGEIAVETFLATDKPTPLAYHILYRYLDAPELVAPDSLAKSSLQRMKLTVHNTDVRLVCMQCGEASGAVAIGAAPERPLCGRCSSSLLAPCFWSAEKTELLVRKKLNREELSPDERTELSRARMAADLVLSYGRRALVALAVYGVGPQTASRVLARMDEDEDSFFRDLLDAELRFIRTRQFWSD